MKKLFIPYGLAVKLKEKGFIEPCLGGYSNLQELHIRRVDFQSDLNGFCLAPLYQQVLDWFRENHKLDISGSWQLNEDGDAKWWMSVSKINELNPEQDFDSILYHNTYYEALNNAIEEAIKLI